jgi:hypothetical protein
MDVSHLHKSIDIDSLCKWLNIVSEETKSAFVLKLSQWQSNENKLNNLSYQFATVQNALENNSSTTNTIIKTLDAIHEYETELQTLLKENSELEKESVSELLFLNKHLSPLNFIPFLLTVWSLVRVYILPGLALLTPILMLVLPYILLRFVFKISMNMDTYFGMIMCLLTGDTQSMLNISTLSFKTIIDSFVKMLIESPGQAITKITGIGITVGQSLFQPYLTYRHLSAINTLITNKSNILSKFKQDYDILFSHMKSINLEMRKNPLPDLTTEREHVAYAILDPTPYKLALKNIGQIDALIQLAIKKECRPVQWQNSSVQFILKNTFDINVDKENRKTFSIDLSNSSHHALLTGPNRGGKSTALRALCVSALLAHTYGCTIGSAKLSPFELMYANMKSEDIPGSKSHFEREVDFSAQTLSSQKPTLVFIDELFHTTNPPDALEACKLYCNNLWNKPNIISVISTHLFELVDNSPNTVQRLCCPAELAPNGSVTYHYGLQDGICKISSVFEIMSKYGYTIQLSAVENDLKKSEDGQNERT